MPGTKQDRQYKLALTALIISNLIWGAAPPIFKFALTNIPPFSLAFLRFAIAATLLLPFLYQKRYWLIKKRDWPLLVQNALFGVILNISFFFVGLKLAPSINASIIASASSIFTSFLAVIFIHERPSSKILFGNFIGFLGVLLIVIGPLKGQTIGNNFNVIIGNFFFVAATLSAAAQVITSRKLAQKYRSRTFTFYSFLVGSLSFLPLAIYEFVKTPLWLADLNTSGLIGIVFGGLFSSFVAYSIWGFAAERITATEIGLYMYLNPVVTILIAVPLLGEKISLPFLIGSAIALAGIYIAEGRLPFVPFHHHNKQPNH